MSYDYKNGKENVIKKLEESNEIFDVLDLKDASKNKNYKTWLACIYVDILESREVFYECENPKNATCGIVSAFLEETDKILKDSPLLYKIKICNDGIYAIYSGSYKDDLFDLLDITFYLNTFIKMFNSILVSKKLNPISAGIGFSCDRGLVIDYSDDSKFISQSIFEAFSLAEIGCKNDNTPICISELIYSNIEKIAIEKFPDFIKWVEKHISSNDSLVYYGCNIVKTDFSNWIDGGMKI